VNVYSDMTHQHLCFRHQY